MFFFLRMWQERERERKKRIFRVPPQSHSPFWKPVVSILVVSRRTQVKYLELFTTRPSKLVSKGLCIETTGKLHFHPQFRPFPLTVCTCVLNLGKNTGCFAVDSSAFLISVPGLGHSSVLVRQQGSFHPDDHHTNQ